MCALHCKYLRWSVIHIIHTHVYTWELLNWSDMTCWMLKWNLLTSADTCSLRQCSISKERSHNYMYNILTYNLHKSTDKCINWPSTVLNTWNMETSTLEAHLKKSELCYNWILVRKKKVCTYNNCDPLSKNQPFLHIPFYYFSLFSNN